MSDQQSDRTVQPQVLAPAVQTYIAPAPPRASRIISRILLGFALILIVFVGIVVGGLYWLSDAISGSSDSWLEETYHSGNKSAKDKIAIVSVDDVIMESTARRVLRQLKAAREDEHVKGIVLKVDSPGGTINASDHIHRKVRELCRDPQNPLPIVVSMQGLAASGGYYISAPANRIFAERTTMTGSIGVIASFPNFGGLMEDYKVRMEVIKTGPMKDSGSPFRQMSDTERDRWHAIIDDAFTTFLEVVSDGRQMEIDRVRALANGGVYTAREAISNGLVDEIGYLEDAIAHAEKLAHVKDSKVIEYRRPLELSELLFGSSASTKGNVSLDLQSLFRANIPRVMFLTQASPIEL